VEHIVKDPITIISVFTLLCFIDWQLTLGSMVLLPVCMIPILVLSPKAREATRKMRATGARQASGIIEMLSGIRVVKAFNLEKQLVEKFRRTSRQLISQAMRSIRATELTTPIIETVSVFGVGVVLVFVTATQRNIPDLVAFFVGLMLFYDPIKKLAKLHLLIVRTSVGIDHLMETLAEVPSIAEPANPVPLKSFTSAITMERVGFHYGDKPVLEDLSLTIPRGWKLGVAGESGSGKSTLVNLLFRFFDPVQGVIQIDGHDLKSVATQDLRTIMALVSQEVVIFDQSVYDNIACGKVNATRAEVIAAARNAYAHDFIMDKPEGYDTRLGERGVNLSGGQRQRIAIARAFIRDSPILILDEATAALDSQSEAEVQRALDHLSENRTVISIAHRLSTLSNCNEVIVLSKGRLVERGPFQDLLKRNSHFAAMARKQGIYSNS
jgi:subfamily B ATP-binding cassette protein MsbA